MGVGVYCIIVHSRQAVECPVPLPPSLLPISHIRFPPHSPPPLPLQNPPLPASFPPHPPARPPARPPPRLRPLGLRLRPPVLYSRVGRSGGVKPLAVGREFLLKFLLNQKVYRAEAPALWPELAGSTETVEPVSTSVEPVSGSTETFWQTRKFTGPKPRRPNTGADGSGCLADYPAVRGLPGAGLCSAGPSPLRFAPRSALHRAVRCALLRCKKVALFYSARSVRNAGRVWPGAPACTKVSALKCVWKSALLQSE